MALFNSYCFKLINQQQIMERSNLAINKVDQNKILSEIISPFPFIEQHKKYDQQPRYRFKLSTKLYSHQITEPFSSSILPAKMSGTKERAQFHNKIDSSPAKQTRQEQIYRTLERQSIKKSLKTNNSNFGNLRNKSLFASVLKSAVKEDLPISKNLSKQKHSNRAYMYQPYKKKSAQYRDKLKPITSEINFINESYFLNVEKMVFSEGGRNKKSSSIIVSAFGESKPNILNKNHKQVPNSKLIKEINLVKERLNVQRVLVQNEQNSCQSKALQDYLSIKTYENILKAEDQCQNIVAISKSLSSSKLQQTSVAEGFEPQKPQPQYKQSYPQVRLENILQKNSVSKRNYRFNVPFETYYYRDLLWKVNFTNNLHVEVPLQYQHRLKVFVGKGNNSCMVSGLISRRYWFALTDRIEEANFVWTQLKMLNYFTKQEAYLEQAVQQQPEANAKATYQRNSIMLSTDSFRFKSYFSTYLASEEHCDERLLPRSKSFRYTKHIKVQEIKGTKMQNHLVNNYVIGNKKALFATMSNFYKEMNQQVFDFLPLTFHIKDGLEDQSYFQFLRYYHKRAKEIVRNNQEKDKPKEYNAWIVKPGENSNRGNGIKMCLNLEEIKSALKKREIYQDGTYRTYIVQAYIERPLLYCRRKFDLRHYIMMTCINGIIKGYWYKDGYVRTTSSQYSLKDSHGSIHLTNDAVQKDLPDYGKYEKGNKISYEDLNSYIEKQHKKNKSFFGSVYPKMKQIGTDAIKACSGGIDPAKLQDNFEIFGMDFMIDANLDVFLIEINSNPCLELSCPLLASIIPKMVENALELTLDAQFPPPVRYCPKGLHYLKQLQKQNKFELVYDSRVEKLYMGSLQVLDNKLLQEEDDTFQDCGDDWQDS